MVSDMEISKAPKKQRMYAEFIPREIYSCGRQCDGAWKVEIPMIPLCFSSLVFISGHEKFEVAAALCGRLGKIRNRQQEIEWSEHHNAETEKDRLDLQEKRCSQNLLIQHSCM